MRSLKEVYAECMEEDIKAVQDWSKEMYEECFSSYFVGQRELYKRFESESHPITDAELETILIDVPLKLFTVAEALSQFRIGQEVTKLKAKQIEREKEMQSVESSETKRKAEASFATLEHKLLITVQSAVVEHVEREISFSRELIMGAKKIWDSRRNAEGAMPVNEHSGEPEPELQPGYNLPEYHSTNSAHPQTYIK